MSNIKFLIKVELATNEIIETRVCQGINPPEGNQGDGTWIIYWRDHIESRSDFMKEHFWVPSSAQLVYRGPKPQEHWTWNKDSMEWESNEEMLLAQVRRIRNGLLNQCDWTQMADADLTDEKKEEWKTYRQALRNITLLVPTAQNKEDLPWPNRPD